MVKRVFITNDLGEDALPKWATWVKVVVDADDLPLNVSREMLQSTKFLRQLKNIITKRIVQMLSKTAGPEEDGGDEERWEQIVTQYNNVFKLGAIEDEKNRDKLASFIKFGSTSGNLTTLDEVSICLSGMTRLLMHRPNSTLSTGSRARSRSSTSLISARPPMSWLRVSLLRSWLPVATRSFS